ncbi:hypothetical protein PMAYCL1PPCAC_29520, partial [Pristionchus mayeri]
QFNSPLISGFDRIHRMDSEEHTSTEEGLRYLRSVFLNKHPEKNNEPESHSEGNTVEEESELFEAENEEQKDAEIQGELTLHELLSKTLDIKAEVVKEDVLIPEKKKETSRKTKTTVPISSLGALVNDMVDKWEEMLLPFKPTSLCILKDAFIATEKGKKPRWLPINPPLTFQVNLE